MIYKPKPARHAMFRLSPQFLTQFKIRWRCSRRVTGFQHGVTYLLWLIYGYIKVKSVENHIFAIFLQFQMDLSDIRVTYWTSGNCLSTQGNPRTHSKWKQADKKGVEKQVNWKKLEHSLRFLFQESDPINWVQGFTWVVGVALLFPSIILKKIFYYY